MIHDLRDKKIVFYGDIHMHVFDIVMDMYNREDGTVYIILGDIGVGFKRIYINRDPKDENAVIVFEDLKSHLKALEQPNSKVYVFRGNHDDPAYFTGELKEKIENDFPFVKIIEDYDEIILNDGKTALVIPGGISVDRARRKTNESYWENELIDYKGIDKIDKHYDVIISHSGPVPQSIAKRDKAGEPSIVTYYSAVDTELYSTIAEEAKFWDKVLDKIKPEKMFCGHYHIDEVNEVNGCTITYLNIADAYEYI